MLLSILNSIASVLMRITIQQRYHVNASKSRAQGKRYRKAFYIYFYNIFLYIKYIFI